jgi:hypothetical protein
VIAGGLRSFTEVGEALAWIRDGRLYLLAGYKTFADYCERRWDMGKSHAYRLINAAEVVAALLPGSEPPNEAQARELARIPDPEDRAAAWQEAVQETGGKPTAAAVRDKAAPRAARPRKATSKPDLAESTAAPVASTYADGSPPEKSSATSAVISR